MADGPELRTLVQRFVELGCDKLFVKPLARNDNTKNQPYFGQEFEAIHILPHETVVPDAGGNGRTRFKAKIDFEWLDFELRSAVAPEAKLIWYPQYPEVRFSGFLRGCATAPSALMQPRSAAHAIPNRILLLGVSNTKRKTYGFLAAERTRAYTQVANILERAQPDVGVFYDCTSLLPLIHDSRRQLLSDLHNVHARGWITAKRLDGAGHLRPCTSPNCGGYTLEAELGVIPNGRAEPDYLGWEVKQHTVSDFTNLKLQLTQKGKPITLMTPEPKKGIYAEVGVKEFVRRYGYKDRLGREQRINFGGRYVCNCTYGLTGMTLRLDGFDGLKNKIDPDGAIVLEDRSGNSAAVWPFADLIVHWSRKHALAVYVPSICETEPERRYRYAQVVRLGEGTNFIRFVRAVHDGLVFYDPGIKLVGAAGADRAKCRSQFRIASGQIGVLYSKMTIESV